MGRSLGVGRYLFGTYPQAAAAGGGGGAIAPLSRQRFIDGDTSQTGLDGSVANPYATIAQFMAARPNVSDADAAANFVGWLMPALAGYTADVVFPPYTSTEIRAASLSLTPGNGVFLTGNVTWNNVGGDFAPSLAVVTMRNVGMTGTFEVLDDGGAPLSAVFIGSDLDNITIGGGFNSAATTRLQIAQFENLSIGSGGVQAGSTTDSAVVEMFSCSVEGPLSGKNIAAFDSIIGSVTIQAFDTVYFQSCSFAAGGGGRALAAPSAAFDGPSWQSFLENGGTRGAGTVVLVVGGYSGGAVEGAALPTTGNTSVALNGVGATAGYSGEHAGNHYTVPSALTGNCIVTLLTAGALEGDTMLITRQAIGGAFTLTVHNGAGTTIGVIPVSTRGFVLARFSGADWVFDAGGSLAA